MNIPLKGHLMKNSLAVAPTFFLALLLSAGVSQAVLAQAPASGVETVEKGGINPQGDTAATVTVSTVTATVQAIDQATRMVTLVRPDGKGVILKAGDQVRNLAQVKVGDKVTVDYYEGFVAELAPPGTPLDKVKVTDAVARAPLGERPAGALGEAVTATVVIEYVDTLRNVVQFKGPLGKTRTVKVMRPQFQAMLKSLKAGDQVTLTYFEALALNVKPAGK